MRARFISPSWALDRAMRELGLGVEHRERVLRLNPNPRVAERLRGLRLSGRGRTDDGICILRDMKTKGQVIRSMGRRFWDRIPKDCCVRRGKRFYVSYLVITRMNRGEGEDVHGEDRPWCMP